MLSLLLMLKLGKDCTVFLQKHYSWEGSLALHFSEICGGPNWNFCSLSGGTLKSQTLAFHRHLLFENVQHFMEQILFLDGYMQENIK